MVTVSGRMLKTDGKMFTGLSAFLSALHVPIHCRNQKGRHSYIRYAEAKSKYGFKKSKGKTRFNTYDSSKIVSTASSKAKPSPNNSVIICHA